MKEALKSRDRVKISVTRMMLADIHNQEIAKHGQLSDEQILAVLQGSVKKHKDSIAQFKTGARDDLVAQEEAEVQVIQSYLPEPVSETELRSTVQAVIEELKPAGPKDFGKVMQAAMTKLKGRADGAAVSQTVKSLLN